MKSWILRKACTIIIKEHSSRYTDVYIQKQEEYTKKLEELEKKKTELQDKTKILQRKIDYIDKYLK